MAGLADMYRQHPIIGSTILGAMGVSPSTISSVNQKVKRYPDEEANYDIDLELEKMMEKVRGLDTELMSVKRGRMQQQPRLTDIYQGQAWPDSAVNFPRR
jgi:hypothetical protein